MGDESTIGEKAKELDKLTIKERMKLPKKTKLKLIISIFIYCAIMVLLSFIL